MAHTLSTPVVQPQRPRKEATWQIKVYQRDPETKRARVVHKATVTAFARDALDKTRIALAATGYHARKLNFAPNNRIIVDASPMVPTQIKPRAPLSRKPKVRISRRAQENT